MCLSRRNMQDDYCLPFQHRCIRGQNYDSVNRVT